MRLKMLHAAVAGTMANGDGYRHYLQAVVQAAQIAWGEGLLRSHRDVRILAT